MSATAEHVEPSPDVDPAALLVGVDLGGTKVRVGLADARGELLGEAEQITRDGGAQLPQQLASLVAGLQAASGQEPASIAAVAIGGAGVDSGEGALALAPNLAGLAGRDVVAEVQAALGAPVVFENDVNVAALGELRTGEAGDNFCFISFGTGVGMGIVLDGRLHTGARGAAGEIGYLPFGADPLDPGVRETGAFETGVAGHSLGLRVSTALGRRVQTPEVFDLADHGDQAARAALEDFARWAALGIAAVVAVLDPPVVVLGGGIGRRPELAALVTPWLERLGCGHVVLLTSNLGPSGPVIGAIDRARLHLTQRGPTS